MSVKTTFGGIASKTLSVSLSKTTKPICEKLASLYLNLETINHPLVIQIFV
jgi:hypothetical protein